MLTYNIKSGNIISPQKMMTSSRAQASISEDVDQKEKIKKLKKQLTND